MTYFADHNGYEPLLPAPQVFRAACRHCQGFSDLVTPPLLQLAADLMATKAASPLQLVLCGRKAAAEAQGGAPQQQVAPSTRCVLLGMTVMEQVFESQAEARC